LPLGKARGQNGIGAELGHHEHRSPRTAPWYSGMPARWASKGIVSRRLTAPGFCLAWNGTLTHNRCVTGPQYHVVTQQPDPNSWRWEWEIYRNGQPLPVRLRGSNHSSKDGAKWAGAKALREFLAALDREQNV
jgi:hypothetical protein